MKRLKFGAFIIMLALFTISVLGCGNSGSSNNAGNSDAEPEAGNGTPAQQITIQFGHPQAINTVHHDAALMFKEEVEKQSNGRIKVDIYPANQLADARGMAEGVQLGTIEMVMVPAAVISNFDSKLNLISFPFLFPNEEVLWKVLDGEVGQEILDGMVDSGIKGLAYWAVGFNQFTANKEIHSVKDFKGLKWRSLASSLVMDQYKTWGANPTAIEFSELYNSLQQGVVDGQENPLQSIVSSKIYEVQSHLTISNHSYMAYPVIANNAWFNSLSGDDQKIISGAVNKITDTERKMIRDDEKAYLKEIEDYGVKVYTMTDEERQAFTEVSLPVHKAHEAEVGAALLQKAYDEIARLSK